MRRVIAIDGLAGSGKSTIARMLAERLGYLHLSTGLIYRAAGYLALKAGIDLDSPSAIVAELGRHHLSLQLEGQSAVILIDGHKIGAVLHTPEVSEATSRTAQYSEVREALYLAQREAFPGKDIVVEGRDMGTVIFPDAQLKIFITASSQVRVERRIRQLYGDCSALSAERMSEISSEMEREILERDHRDQTRTTAPTVASADSVVIDNSSKGLEQLIIEVETLVSERGLNSR